MTYSNREILNSSDDPLYLAQREGANFSYSFPVVNGQYSVRLHFAECRYTTAGQRRFRIMLNGAIAQNDFDPFVAAGAANKAIIKTYPITVTAGKIDLGFVSTLSGRGAGVAAIEIRAK